MKKPLLVPQPKQMRMTGGTLSLDRNGLICLAGRMERGLDIAETLRDGLLPSRQITGLSEDARPSKGCVVLRTGTRTIRTEEGYRLHVGRDRIEIDSAGERGLFYGVQTLLQLGRQYGTRLPRLVIADWPDFPNRGVYLDMARGRVPKVDEVCRIIETLATYKINHFQLYVEHTFKFRKHPKIGRGASPYSAEDMLRIDRHAKQHFVEFTPSLASFGHLHPVLSIPDYHHLAEDGGKGIYHPEADVRFRGRKDLRGWTLSPVVPEVYDFVDDLYGEFLPNFSSGLFNVCCDETWDLGKGRSYDRCRKAGRGKVYLEHVLKIRRIAERYGKKIMFWGDIILHYPELIRKIPDDVIVLNWGYEPDHPFRKRCRQFADARREQWVCPGTGSWASLFPRVWRASQNISRFAEAGLNAGATGLLNTDWGDGGHFNFHDYSWFSYLVGADCSWNVKSGRNDFARRFSMTFFGDPTGELGKAVWTLGRSAELKYWANRSYAMMAFFAPLGDEMLDNFSVSLAKRALSMAGDARGVFEAFRKEGTAPSILKQYEFAADTMRAAAEKILLHHRMNRNPGRARELKARHRAGMRRLRKRFTKLWMSHSRKSEIRITLGKYDKAME